MLPRKRASAELSAIAELLLAELASGFPVGYSPILRWRNLRVSAGLAHFREGAISLSIPLLDSKVRLEATLRHEYAHLLAYSRCGAAGRGHGAAWRLAMSDLGVAAEVRHRFDVRRNASRQVVIYRCDRCEAVIERKRRLPRGRLYLHVDCGGSIRLARIAANCGSKSA